MADLGLQDRPPIPQSKALASGLPNTVDSGMLCGTDTLPYRRLPLSQSIRPRLTYITPGGARPPTRLPNRLCRRRLPRLVGTRDRGGVGGILLYHLYSHSSTPILTSGVTPLQSVSPFRARVLLRIALPTGENTLFSTSSCFSGHHRSRPPPPTPQKMKK